VTPSESQFILSVGATMSTNHALHGSNYGGCIGLYAPGHNVLGPWNGNPSQEVRKSGSSVSSAIISGLFAAFLTILTSDPKFTETVSFLSSEEGVNLANRFLAKSDRVSFDKNDIVEPHSLPYVPCNIHNITNMRNIITSEIDSYDHVYRSAFRSIKKRMSDLKRTHDET
jgi:hypothetical protein